MLGMNQQNLLIYIYTIVKHNVTTELETISG